MYYKTILKGNFDFGTQRSYDQVYKMFIHKAENYYKGRILIDPEDVFDSETHSISFHRCISMATKKAWTNTLALIEYMSQFALVGTVGAWMTEEGKILDHKYFEPQGDKTAVQHFLRGKDLFSSKGKESEALDSFSKAIHKYEKHAQAYTQRGKVNYHLKNWGDAIYDFTKSISIDDTYADAYLGRAYCHLQNKDLEEAIIDFGSVIKNSIPLQPMYWRGRRLRSEANMKLKKYSAVIEDLKFYTKRAYSEESENYLSLKNAYFQYSLALYNSNDFELALENVEKALEMTIGKIKGKAFLPFMMHAVLLKILGKKGFMADVNKAKELGASDNLFQKMVDEAQVKQLAT